ncbi:DUF1173 family protein [Nocardia shimofusensis]|uniref:DUF1173 family protein n=1 Tax=Nocardia shimofusensis TaxID=228596 RepID=UPI001C3F9E31|nr:DUF1173 family protein [Nocardia shimofusensis]
MAEYVDWVRLDGKTVRLSEVRADPDGHVRLLADARANKSARCLCRQPGLALVTRSTQAGRHFLACWPGGGPAHHPECAFFRIDPQMSGRGRCASAITETETGTSIRFAAPLVSQPGEHGERVDAATYPGLGRRSLGLLGLVHYCWETAGLASWTASTRSRGWRHVTAAMASALEGTTINGQPARSVVYVVPPYRPDRAQANLASFDAFMDSLRPDHPDRIRRGFILGELKAVHEARKTGWRYQLAQQSPGRQVFVSDRLDARLRRSYRNAMSEAAARAGGRRIMLFYVERSPGGFARAVDAAVMLTNTTYIPADSSYEARMADALIAAGRSFVKPLVYDADVTDEVTSAVFPDFILTDETPPTYVEVWGLPGQELYERRKSAKRAHYQRQSARLLEWTVTEPMPVVPPPGRTGMP